jgi:signal transduction histidine kinase
MTLRTFEVVRTLQESAGSTPGELAAALLQIAITLSLAALCGLLYRRYRKPYLGWFALAWLLYLLRLLAITTFLATDDRVWLYWHQVATGWAALGLLWAALVFSRAPSWRWRYLVLLVFPVAWSYFAIYRLDNFLLAAGPAVLFLSVVTLGTGWVFLQYHRQIRTGGAALLAGALTLWGFHHLDYPFLRARGAWNPWGYYLDILFTLATGAGILVLLLDDQRLGLSALLTLSGDLQREPASDGTGRLLERPLGLPAVRGSALYALREGRPELVRGAGVCAGWPTSPGSAETATLTRAIQMGEPCFAASWRASDAPGARIHPFAAVLPVFLETTTWALVIVGDARDPFAALDRRYLVALGQQIGAALNSAGLNRTLTARTSELERLSRSMIQQHERERRALSLYLHDETAQLFTAVKLQLGVIRERAAPGLQEPLGRVLALMDDGLSSIRNLTDDLRPSLLDDLGLLPALRSLAADMSAQTGLAVSLDAPETLPPVGGDAELAVYRALQESLSNAAQHAGAKQVAVTVRVHDGQVVLEVQDDGRGLPAAEAMDAGGRLGLSGMRERLVGVGGTLDLANAAAGGARLVARVPVAGA